MTSATEPTNVQPILFCVTAEMMALQFYLTLAFCAAIWLLQFAVTDAIADCLPSFYFHLLGWI
jgi:hypothetical protein